jgi:hypothetical protein
VVAVRQVEPTEEALQDFREEQVVMLDLEDHQDQAQVAAEPQ